MNAHVRSRPQRRLYLDWLMLGFSLSTVLAFVMT